MKSFIQWITEGRSFEYKGNTYSSGFGRYTKDENSISKEEYDRISNLYKKKENNLKISNKELPKNAIPSQFIKDDLDEDAWFEFLKDKKKSLSLRKYFSSLTGVDMVDNDDFHMWCFREGDKVGEGGKYLSETVLMNARRKYELDKKLKDEGIDEKNFKKLLNKSLKSFTKDAELCIRCKRTQLSNILKDGRFKSQFETKTSNGHFNLSIRSCIEAVGQGLPFKTKKKDRPIYGTLKHTWGEDSVYLTSTENDSYYGDMCVVLKKDKFKSNTTMCIGDSLADKLISTPIDNPDYTSMLAYLVDGCYDLKEFYTELQEENENVIHNHLGGYYNKYAECQIKGGVTTNDIDYVIYNGYRSSMPEEVIEELKENNIKFVFKEEY